MKVVTHNRQKDLPIYQRSLQKLVEIVLSLHKKETDQVIMHFVRTDEICSLHEQFFADPTTTDCISFPIDPEGEMSPRILGEIFVCPRTAMDYSASHELDPYRETALYVVHGLLHCLGYDDLDPLERRRMRRQEKRAMDAIALAQVTLRPKSAIQA